MVLGTVDTATQALHHVRAAFGDHPRAWVTDESDLDVSIPELARLSEEEQRNVSERVVPSSRWCET